MTLDDIKNGQVFLIDKPLNWTSFDVVNKMRYTLSKNFKQKKLKVGHAGTLDPLATGLLIVCCGKETKNIDSYQATTKTYTGTITLGATTPSYDLETAPGNFKNFSHITLELVTKIIQKKFLGEIQQFPPMFSAVSVGGQRLYEAARKGAEVERPSRQVTIEKFEINAFNLPKLEFEVVCSKGTYIRSLADDLGRELAVGAYLSSLRRTASGEFLVSSAVSIEEFCVKFPRNE